MAEELRPCPVCGASRGLYVRTCRYVRDHMGAAGNWLCKCSECGAEFDERVVDSHFVYCPECGAKVVDE